MTNREFYNAIINSNVSDELKDHAQYEIEKLNARNEKRANTPSKTAIANAPLIEKIKGFLEKSNEPMCAAEIGEALELTSNKVAAIICSLDVEVTTKKYNKRKVRAYALKKERE